MQSTKNPYAVNKKLPRDGRFLPQVVVVQKPLAAARAVIFAQMVDDPSSLPDLFPTTSKQEAERQRLFDIIEAMVLWDNTGERSIISGLRLRYGKAGDGRAPTRPSILLRRNYSIAIACPFLLTHLQEAARYRFLRSGWASKAMLPISILSR